MTALSKLPLLGVSIALQVLALAVAIGPFFRLDKIAYVIGLSVVIFMALISYYGDLFFDGIVDTRRKTWPKVFFISFGCVLIALAWLSVWKHAGWPQLPLKELLPRLAISLLLLWYGSSVLFSSFFMGKGVAIFMHNPAAWAFGKNKSKLQR